MLLPVGVTVQPAAGTLSTYVIEAGRLSVSCVIVASAVPVFAIVSLYQTVSPGMTRSVVLLIAVVESARNTAFDSVSAGRPIVTVSVPVLVFDELAVTVSVAVSDTVPVVPF